MPRQSDSMPTVLLLGRADTFAATVVAHLRERKVHCHRLSSATELARAVDDTGALLVVIFADSASDVIDEAVQTVAACGRKVPPGLVLIADLRERLPSSLIAKLDLVIDDNSVPAFVARRIARFAQFRTRTGSDASRQSDSGRRVAALDPASQRPERGRARYLRALYVSKSLVVSGGDDDVSRLAELARNAREFNALHGITGVLLRYESYFVQVLEGSHREVLALLSRIEKDIRHFDFRLRETRAVETRLFSDWSLCCIDATRVEHVPPRAPFRPAEMSPDELIAFLQMIALEHLIEDDDRRISYPDLQGLLLKAF